MIVTLNLDDEQLKILNTIVSRRGHDSVESYLAKVIDCITQMIEVKNERKITYEDV